MTMDIGSRAVLVHLRGQKLLILCGILLLFAGCDGGGDRLSELASKFALQRDEINQARELIQALAATENISEIEVGVLYNETPDKVRFGRDSSLVPLGTIALKDSKNRERLERLSALARRISCRAVIIDEMRQVWVVMYYARNYDYGYAFLDRSGVKTHKEEEYVQIQGEEKWLAYRR